MQPLVNLGLQKITETVGTDFNAKENQKKANYSFIFVL